MGSPMIFSGLGIRHGKSEALMYLFDIFPTACDLAGLDTPNGLDGHSVRDVIRGNKREHRDTIFLSYEKGQRAIRRGDWKLYRFPLVNHSMLFNLAEDPHELHDLAQDPRHATRVQQMLKLLAEQQLVWNEQQPLTTAAGKPARIKDVSLFTKTEKEVKRRKKKQRKN